MMQKINKYRSASLILLIACLMLSAPMAVKAAETESDSISWFVLSIGLLGGLAFFLYGMEKMSEGMKRTAGNRMRSILTGLTRNRIIALLVGAFVTTIIQSSSATTVMLVGFVQAELMSFAQSLGVILGANIGTTITAQMVAFKLTDYAIIMIILGFFARFTGKNGRIKSIGDIMLGFGILFYGMKMMNDTMQPLRSYPEFIQIMKGLQNPLTGVLAGAGFTALVQSSSATTGIIIVLAQQNLITIESGIPVILGANIGTCITAGLASIGTARDAKRVALAHVLFNVGGVLLFLFWIPQFAGLIHRLGDVFQSDTAREIANAHTIFNVAVAVVFIPFTSFFASAILRILPDRPREKGLEPIAWHLDDAHIKTPAIALQLASSEIARMAKILGRMHKAAIVPFVSTGEQRDAIFPKQLSLLEGIAMRENKINFLEDKIREYLLKISRQELTQGQDSEVNALIAMLDSMERIGDVITRQIVPLVKKKEAIRLDFSKEGKAELILYHQKVGKQIKRLENMMSKMDVQLAKKVKKKKSRYEHFDSQMRKNHLERMLTMKEASVQTHSIHMELMDALHQINIYSAEIAKKLLNYYRTIAPPVEKNPPDAEKAAEEKNAKEKDKQESKETTAN